MGLEVPVNRGFRDEVARGVGEPDGQRPGRQFRLIESQVHDLAAASVRDTLLHPAGTTGAIFKASFAEGPIAIVPPIACRARNTQLIQGAPDRCKGGELLYFEMSQTMSGELS